MARFLIFYVSFCEFLASGALLVRPRVMMLDTLRQPLNRACSGHRPFKLAHSHSRQNQPIVSGAILNLLSVPGKGDLDAVLQIDPCVLSFLDRNSPWTRSRSLFRPPARSRKAKRRGAVEHQAVELGQPGKQESLHCGGGGSPTHHPGTACGWPHTSPSSR